MPETDPHDLQRFIAAQDSLYRQVLAELRAGDKTSHWMWFIFPQLKALGRSATAHRYGIASAQEALAYWQHPLLGPRLRECTEIVCALTRERSAHDIFHAPDDLKFRSCVTLFSQVAPEEPVFQAALRRYFNGEPDRQTIRLLGTDARKKPD